MKRISYTLSLQHYCGLVILLLCHVFTGCKMTKSTFEVLPRNMELPLFDPHARTYICDPSSRHPTDAEADAWFREARALESAEVYVGDRDYKEIVRLTRQAADRHHWEAMLNLASFILEGREPAKGAEDAVRLVEDAMRHGVPAAYDRMGTFYMNGTGVPASATRAYAFWQAAAKLGDPASLTFLAEKLVATYDAPDGSWWANAAVGIKMLECAYSQGYGPAAYALARTYTLPLLHPVAQDDLAQALIIWHNGVKYGCQKCASTLSIQFGNPLDPTLMVAPHIDTARAARYVVLSDALSFDPERKFPNLDKILPLPPAELPAWDGKRDTLVNAAKGVSHTAVFSKASSPVSERNERYHLSDNYRLEKGETISCEIHAPFGGFWQPRVIGDSSSQQGEVAAILPGLYRSGERFDRVVGSSRRSKSVDNLVWEHWRTVRYDRKTVAPPIVRGRTREIAAPANLVSCAENERCPVTGVWQPWLSSDHQLAPLVNQCWRQAWIAAGQSFPDPRRDWKLQVNAVITWYLFDSNDLDICGA